MDTDAALRELVDERAIASLMVDYFDAVDALDPYRAVEIFTDDVEGDFMTGRLYHGRPAIARALGKILLQYERTSHHITNHKATVVGDSATALTYIYAFHRMRGSDDTWHLWARHADELVRLDEGWRVRRRVLVAIDSVPRGEKIDDAWYYGHPGRRAHAELERQLAGEQGRS